VLPGELVAFAVPTVLRPVLSLATLARGAVGIGYSVRASTTSHRVIAFEPVSGIPGENLVRLDERALAQVRDPSSIEHPGFLVDPDAAALAAASSGTTGMPKTVVFSTVQLIRRVAAARRSWIPDTTFASLLGPDSMSGQVAFLAALQRRMVHIVPGKAATNLAQLGDHGIRAVKGSPAQLADLLRSARRAGERLPALDVIESAGSPVGSSLAGDLARWFEAEVRSLYGATEAGTVAIVDDATRPEGAARILPGARVEIIDMSGRPVSKSTVGRIRIRTDGIAIGYLGDGDSSSERGIHDGWFLPGDLGTIVGDELRVLGRNDDLINAAGVKVSAAHIEEFAKRQPGIHEAVACGVIDVHGVRQIALAIAGDPVRQPTDLVTALQKDLGDVTPRIIVRLADIPRTESAKVDRVAVAEFVQARLVPGIEL
jgi:acyl-coenzyme A synthetase/AMP-(fatty) acid ligase